MKNGGATKADGGATTPSNLAWSTFSVVSDHIQTIRCDRPAAALRRWREAGLVLEPAGEMAEAFELAQEDLHSTFPDIGEMVSTQPTNPMTSWRWPTNKTCVRRQARLWRMIGKWLLMV